MAQLSDNKSGRVSDPLTRGLAKVCLKNSEYDYVRGGHGGDFLDVDELYGDRPGRDLETLVEEAIVERVQRIQSEQPLRAVVFVERDNGPVGLVASRFLIAKRLDLPTWTVRPRKRIRRAVLKGGTLKPGDRVVIVTDVATTGTTIAEAARAIWQLGGQVAGAISLVDRESGAKETLEQVDIDLDSIRSIDDLRAVHSASAQPSN